MRIRVLRQVTWASMGLLWVLWGGSVGADVAVPNWLNQDQLLEVAVEMEAEDWARLRAQTRPIAWALRKPAAPRPFTYFPATVTIGGQRFERVAIRKKGFVGSLDQQYPSLKIKFHHYVKDQRPPSFSRVTLNNNKQDPAVVRQYLAYRVFAAAGVPAPRCCFSRVTVNGEYLGIYSHVESVRRPLLERVWGDASGKLYEGSLADFVVGRVDDFEAKHTRAEDRSELAELARLLAREEPLTEDDIAKYVDVDAFLRFWVTESLLNAWDGYTSNQNNYFLYLHGSQRTFQFLPWGPDATFQRREAEMEKSREEAIHGGALLAYRLYRIPGIADRYRAVLEDVLATAWDEPALLAEIDRLEEFLGPHLHRRQRGAPQAMADVRQFIRTRRNVMEYGLERWPVATEETPKKTTRTRSVGQAQGHFVATWLPEAPANAYEGGETELQLRLDGDLVGFSRLGVAVDQTRDKGGVRSIRFTGKRESNRIRLEMTLEMSEARFRAAKIGEPVIVQGTLSEGGFGFFGLISPKGMRLVAGNVTFTERGTEQGERVSGTIDVDVMRLEQW